MSLSFDSADALAQDLAGFLNLPERQVRDRLTEGNWRRVALKYNVVLDLIDKGATYFTRAWKIRQNPQWAPDRPIRAELKLERINKKVDAGVRHLFEVLEINLPADARDQAVSEATNWDSRADETGPSEGGSR